MAANLSINHFAAQSGLYGHGERAENCSIQKAADVRERERANHSLGGGRLGRRDTQARACQLELVTLLGIHTGTRKVTLPLRSQFVVLRSWRKTKWDQGTNVIKRIRCAIGGLKSEDFAHSHVAKSIIAVPDQPCTLLGYRLPRFMKNRRMSYVSDMHI